MKALQCLFKVSLLIFCSEQRSQRSADRSGGVMFRQRRTTLVRSRPGARRRRRPHQDVPQEAEAATVLPLQRPPGLRQYHHQQEEVQQTAHHSS